MDVALGLELSGITDPTGWQAHSQVRARARRTAPLLATLAATVELVDGKVCAVLRWSAEASLSWGWEKGYLDIVLTSPDGRPVAIPLRASLKLIPVVTTIG